MRITLKLYGNLKQYAPGKQASAEIDLEPETTISELLARLGVPDSRVWMCAVNETVIETTVSLKDNDVLEVFEPVGGGGDPTPL